jgi:hypothetical protein
LHPFGFEPAGEAPWAHLLGKIRPTFRIRPYETTWVIRNSAILAILMAAFIGVFRARARSCALGIYASLNVLAFWSVSATLGHASTSALESLRPMFEAIPPSIRPGTQIVVAGPSPSVESAGRFGLLSRATGLDETSVLRLEILKRLDVRVVGSLAQLTRPELRGKFFLSVVRFPSLPVIQEIDGYHLYRLPTQVDSKFRSDGHPRTIDADSFLTNTCQNVHKEIICEGKGVEDYLVFGPYRALSSGRYHVTFLTRSKSSKTYEVNAIAADRSEVLVRATVGPERTPTLEFTTNGNSTLEFRILGRDEEGFKFRGVELDRDTSATAGLIPDWRFQVPSRIFLTANGRVAQDGIHGDGSKRDGFLVFGPYTALPSGLYRVTVLIEARPGDVFHSEVTMGGKVLCTGPTTSRSPLSCEFETRGREPVEFRVVGPSTPEFIFRGVTLSSLRGID